MHELEHRLARLERQNRTLRRWLVALTVVFGVAVCAGAAVQKGFPEFKGVKADLVITKTLLIAERGGTGAPNIQFRVRDGKPGMIFSDGRHSRIEMVISDHNPAFIMLDANGEPIRTLRP